MKSYAGDIQQSMTSVMATKNKDYQYVYDELDYLYEVCMQIADCAREEI